MSNPLLKTLAAAIREAYNAPKKDQPELLRAVADLIVEVRSRTTNGDGAPDWRGNSYEYRMLVSEAYSDGGVPYEDRIRFGNSLRYHVSNALRARLTAEDLQVLGLKPENGVRRSQQQRDARRGELYAARRSGFDKRASVSKRRGEPVDKEIVRARLLKMLADLDEA